MCVPHLISPGSKRGESATRTVSSTPPAPATKSAAWTTIAAEACVRIRCLPVTAETRYKNHSNLCLSPCDGQWEGTGEGLVLKTITVGGCIV